jgi:hypothetical protein
MIKALPAEEGFSTFAIRRVFGGVGNPVRHGEATGNRREHVLYLVVLMAGWLTDSMGFPAREVLGQHLRDAFLNLSHHARKQMSAPRRCALRVMLAVEYRPCYSAADEPETVRDRGGHARQKFSEVNVGVPAKVPTLYCVDQRTGFARQRKIYGDQNQAASYDASDYSPYHEGRSVAD